MENLTKKSKIDENNMESKNLSINSKTSDNNENYNFLDWVTMTPSSTVLMYYLPYDCAEKGLKTFLRPYGKIQDVKLLLGKNTALIEFKDIKNAKYLVDVSKTSPVHVGPVCVNVEFSSKNIYSFIHEYQSNVPVATEFTRRKLPASYYKKVKEDLQNQQIQQIQQFQQPDLLSYYYYNSMYYAPYQNNWSYSTMPSQYNYYNVNPWYPQTESLPNGATFQNQIFNMSNDPDLMTIKNEEGVVVEINNLPPNFTCDNIFNLLCLFGNIVTVNICCSDTRKALVQMGNAISAQYICQYYNEVTIFGHILKFVQTNLSNMPITEFKNNLPNGTSSLKSYRNSLTNRFRVGLKSKILTPSSTLHFYNIPLYYTKNDIIELFTMKKSNLPKNIIIFKNINNKKCLTGLLQFNSIGEALETILIMNNSPIYEQSGLNVFNFKLTFNSNHDTNKIF